MRITYAEAAPSDLIPSTLHTHLTTARLDYTYQATYQLPNRCRHNS